MSRAAKTTASVSRKTGKAHKVAGPAADERAPKAVAAALLRELVINFEFNCLVFTGSAPQLIDAGVLSADFDFSGGIGSGKKGVQVPGCDRALVSNLGPLGNAPPFVDRWIVYAWLPKECWRKPYTNADHWSDVAIGTPAGALRAKRFSDAHLDQRFQRAMNFDGLIQAVKETL